MWEVTENCWRAPHGPPLTSHELAVAKTDGHVSPVICAHELHLHWFCQQKTFFAKLNDVINWFFTFLLLTKPRLWTERRKILKESYELIYIKSHRDVFSSNVISDFRHTPRSHSNHSSFITALRRTSRNTRKSTEETTSSLTVPNYKIYFFG